MDKRYYEVELKTSLGVKKGSLSLNVADNKLNGILVVLKHAEPFSGVIDNSGNCYISGHIVSLMRIVPFTATGIIAENELKLQLKGERNTFELVGKSETRGNT